MLVLQHKKTESQKYLFQSTKRAPADPGPRVWVLTFAVGPLAVLQYWARGCWRHAHVSGTFFIGRPGGPVRKRRSTSGKKKILRSNIGILIQITNMHYLNDVFSLRGSQLLLILLEMLLKTQTFIIEMISVHCMASNPSSKSSYSYWNHKLTLSK